MKPQNAIPAATVKSATKAKQKRRKLQNMLRKSEVRRLERSTPFYLSGKLLSAEQDDDMEKMFSKMTLADLEINLNDKIGEGAYGNVYTAVYTPTGTKLAIKKVP